ncbi:MAG: cysteine hydrolase [Xanthomonadaceae bacterium]|nr:cysteine hydrolase [Xanthomonadaceae bacterium]
MLNRKASSADYKGPPIRWTLAEQVSPGAAAVLIVDMQVDFVADDGVLGRRGVNMAAARQVIPRVNALVDEARAAGIPVIWIRTTHRLSDSPPPYLAMYMPAGREGRWDEGELPACEGSPGAEPHPEVVPAREDELVVVKRTYSAFYGTPLAQILTALGLETIILAGVNTNVCIHATAADAFFQGWYPVLCSDACATAEPAIQDAFLATHERFYGLTATVEELARVWRSVEAPVAS